MSDSNKPIKNPLKNTIEKVINKEMNSMREEKEHVSENTNKPILHINIDFEDIRHYSERIDEIANNIIEARD